MKRTILLTCVGSLAFVLAAGAADEQNNNPPHKKGGNAAAAAATQQGQPNVHVRSTTNAQIHARHISPNAQFRSTGGMNAGVQSNVTTQDLRVHRNHQINQSVATNPLVSARVRTGGSHVTVTNNWRGERFNNQRYSAFRNYHREFHDRDWWRHHHSRIVFYFGAPYYWDTGYWYPAWGYNPGYTYEYDGPIYGYNGLAPDQVLITVQTRLQQEGYYQGAVDGTMGPLTRQALADFQADHGLAVTASVDEPTLATMGLS
ncbi:MAG: hypothetical protein QOI04_733 [Verrucomicrobiota bacterium]|jgi:hypothetical protein